MSFWWERRLKSGYANLGPITIPPLPQSIILTDRTTLQQWLLSFRTNPDRISITQDLFSIQKREGARVFDKDTRPVFEVGLGKYSLFLDNGRLGVAFNSFPGDVTEFDNAPLYARQLNDKRVVNFDTADIRVLHLGIIV